MGLCKYKETSVLTTFTYDNVKAKTKQCYYFTVAISQILLVFIKVKYLAKGLLCENMLFVHDCWIITNTLKVTQTHDI